LNCLERKIEMQAMQIDALSRRVREFTTPGVKPLGMAQD
jgi:hypothetical protein